MGARVIKYINCLEKQMDGELVQSTAATLNFVTGFDADVSVLSASGSHLALGKGNLSPWHG